MEADALTLLQMPEVIMGHILGKLDLPDILILRKTCHQLRNIIDDLHPDPKIVGTVIDAYPECIEFIIALGHDYNLYPEGKELRIKYSVVKSAPNDCTVQWFRSDGVGGAYLNDCNFVAQFCRDFDSIFSGNTFEFSKNLKNPSKIQDFHLNLEYSRPILSQLVPFLESTLKNRLRPLPVEAFHITNYDTLQVLQFLSFFEPKTLEKISITHRESKWNLHGFSELEQWRMAKIFWNFDYNLDATVRELMDFEEISIRTDKVEVEEVLKMKEAILNSTTKLKTGRVEFRVCDAEQHFLQTYGYPFTDVDEFDGNRRSWFFKIPNKKLVLRISFYYMKSRFTLLENPPRNASTSIEFRTTGRTSTSGQFNNWTLTIQILRWTIRQIGYHQLNSYSGQSEDNPYTRGQTKLELHNTRTTFTL
ncbi:unnamed protein product [Caenorhabditis brenneri]